jgi:hypothetical protein
MNAGIVTDAVVEKAVVKKPNGRGLKRAQKKLKRLKSRNARPRAVRRLSARVSRLMADYERRVAERRVGKAEEL